MSGQHVDFFAGRRTGVTITGNLRKLIEEEGSAQIGIEADIFWNFVIVAFLLLTIVVLSLLLCCRHCRNRSKANRKTKIIQVMPAPQSSHRRDLEGGHGPPPVRGSNGTPVRGQDKRPTPIDTSYDSEADSDYQGAVADSPPPPAPPAQKKGAKAGGGGGRAPSGGGARGGKTRSKR